MSLTKSGVDAAGKSSYFVPATYVSPIKLLFMPAIWILKSAVVLTSKALFYITSFVTKPVIHFKSLVVTLFKNLEVFHVIASAITANVNRICSSVYGLCDRLDKMIKKLH